VDRGRCAKYMYDAVVIGQFFIKVSV